MTRMLTEAQVRMMFAADDTARYQEGYRSGRGDKLLARASVIAQTSTSEAYRTGYRDGQLDTHTLEGM